MTPREHREHINGIELCWFEWGEDASGKPPLVFAHATGFHARVWDAIIEHFPDRRVLSLDMRGHGRSGGGPIDHWETLSADVIAWAESLDLEGAIGIGHSMGAHTLLQCAADAPGLFRRLVLFDPVILPPEYYSAPAASREPHPAARRKRDFVSVDAMIERFRDRDPYSLFDPRVFDDYCRFGLLPKAEGEGFELACSPETEASVYESSRSNSGIIDAARSVTIPVLVVRAEATGKLDFKGSPTWPELAGQMPAGTDLYRPDMTHFHPLQDPADAARIIAEFIA